MDLGPLRALVRDLNFTAHGITVSIETTDPPLETRGIWLTPETLDAPGGFELRRRERTNVLAIPTIELPAHGTIVYAPGAPGAPNALEVARYRVDGIEGVESDHIRLRLVPAPDEIS